MPLRLTRRQLLAAGLGTVAGVAIRIRASAESDDNSPGGDAYAPWREWRGAPPPGPRTLVNAAILAANAHDTQPWFFCVNPGRIDLYADEVRNLGAMDPFRREMRISLGCAMENLCLAARAGGYSARVAIERATLGAPAPVSGTRRVASIALARGPAEVSPLYAAIPARHTNRGPYDRERTISANALAKLAALGSGEPGVRLFLLTEAGARAEFAAATTSATEAIIADPAMIRDSDAWFRGSDAEIAAHRDGPTIAAAGLSPFVTFMARILPAPSPARTHRIWLEQTRDVQLATAGAFGLIAVGDLYDQEQALRAGMLWERLHLQATRMGLAAQPMNQLPERVDREKQLGLPATTEKALASLTGAARWRPTFAFRLGFPVRPAPASPRRDPKSVIMSAGCA
jgi:nitroreductase